MESLPPMDDPFVNKDEPSFPTQRPGCITAYVLIFGTLWTLGFFGTMLITFGVMGVQSNDLPRNASFITVLIVFVIVAIFVLLLFVYLRGVWQMRNWARIVAIGLHSLGLCGSLVQIANGSMSRVSRFNSGPTIVGAIIGLLIALYIVYWFATNREKFN
jgi:hypothetical protein